MLRRFLPQVCAGLLFCLAVVSGPAQAQSRAVGPSKPFSLDVRDGLVSLEAEGSSLRQVVGELGRQLRAQVVALDVPVDPAVVISLRGVPVQNALRVLSEQSGMRVVATRRDGRIVSLVVKPINKRALGEQAREVSFAFDVDPSWAPTVSTTRDTERGGSRTQASSNRGEGAKER